MDKDLNRRGIKQLESKDPSERTAFQVEGIFWANANANILRCEWAWQVCPAARRPVKSDKRVLEMRFGEPIHGPSPSSCSIFPTCGFHHSQISDFQEDIPATGQYTNTSLTYGALHLNQLLQTTNIWSASVRLTMSALEFWAEAGSQPDVNALVCQKFGTVPIISP